MKKFLASVGNAQLLGRDASGNLVHIMDTKTLTESSLSFSTTMEEIRAGEGAKLYGRFAHDSSMTVTLTDAMFDLEYIKLQVGAEIERNASVFYNDEEFTMPETNTIRPNKTVAPIGNACGLDKRVVWVKERGCNVDGDWEAFVMEDGADTFSLEGTDLAGKTQDQLCLKYFVIDPSARMIQVASDFFPSECILLLTTKLFAGDASSKETGKPIGAITVKIPRFQLDGQFDLSMAMSSASSTNLQGTALTVEDGSCEGAGVYCEIVEIINNADFRSDLKDIAFDADYNKVGDLPVVYGLFKGNSYSKLDNALLTFNPVLDANGKFTTAGTQTVKVMADDGETVIAEDSITVVSA